MPPNLESQDSHAALEDFEELFRVYAPFVWRVLGRLGVEQPDLADASQEVFLVVHRRADDFEGRSSVKTWIFGICVRVAASFRRRIRRITAEPFSESRIGVEWGSPESHLDQQRARERLMRVLSELDDDKRAVFVLYELEDLSMPEVAEALGCPLTTAYSRLHAARKAVKTAFVHHGLAERGIA